MIFAEGSLPEAEAGLLSSGHKAGYQGGGGVCRLGDVLYRELEILVDVFRDDGAGIASSVLLLLSRK